MRREVLPARAPEIQLSAGRRSLLPFPCHRRGRSALRPDRSLSWPVQQPTERNSYVGSEAAAEDRSARLNLDTTLSSHKYLAAGTGRFRYEFTELSTVPNSATNPFLNDTRSALTQQLLRGAALSILEIGIGAKARSIDGGPPRAL